MGMGIVQVAAQVAKLPVIVMDTSSDQIAKQVKFMGTELAISGRRAHAGLAPGRRRRSHPPASLGAARPARSLACPGPFCVPRPF